jgi:hypothetical protein
MCACDVVFEFAFDFIFEFDFVAADPHLFWTGQALPPVLTLMRA